MIRDSIAKFKNNKINSNDNVGIYVYVYVEKWNC